MLSECFDRYTESSGIYTIMMSLPGTGQFKIESLSLVKSIKFTFCAGFRNYIGGKLIQLSMYDKIAVKS